MVVAHVADLVIRELNKVVSYYGFEDAEVFTASFLYYFFTYNHGRNIKNVF